MSKEEKIKFPPGVKEISSNMNLTELSKCLKKCCRFFSELEQHDNILFEYKSFVEYIVQDEFILLIKDVNCSVYLGCLITDIFRVYAPNNPFNSSDQLKNIFLFISKQIELLKDPKDPIYHKAFHILNNLAMFKCYNICTELDSENSTEIFVDLFRKLLSTVNSAHDATLKSHMLDIMTFVVTDTPRLSQSLLEIILQSLLEPSQRMNPSAFELSKELLRRASVIIEQALVTYFQYNVITSKQTPSLVSSKWDKLIPIMYLISPPLLLNTLPQFEFKLKVDSPKERLQTVQLFSQMFSSKDSLLADQYNKLWLAFLGRFNDIDSEVRCACVRFYWHLTVNHGPTSLMSKEALTFFKPRRHDTDENVRLEVVRAIRGISIHDLRLISDELLGFLEDRVKDKKWKVREGAIRAMADIYRKYVTCSARVRSNVNRLYSFRNSLLHVYYHQSCEDAVLLERMLISSLVPYKSTDEERMKLLLELYVTVDDNSLKAIAEIIKNHCRMQRALHDVIEAFTIESEEERFKQIWPSVVTMASLVPGSTQVAREHIKKFIRAAHQDTRLRQLLTYIVRSDYKCRKIETSVRDILKKVESDGMSKQTRQIIQQILERAVILPIIIDSDALKILFDLVKSSLDEESEIDELNSEKAQKRSLDLLKLLSQLSPHIYNNQECFEDLLVLLRRKNDYVIDSVMLIFEKTAHLLEENFPEIRA